LYVKIDDMSKLNKDYVICHVCGSHYKQVTASHLKNKHSMTMEEYNKVYDSPNLVCEEVSKKKSASVEKSKRNKSYTAWNKGQPQSIEQKEKQSHIMKEKYRDGTLVHWNTGKTHSNDTKRKISEKLVGHDYFNDDAIKKRNNTIQTKVDNGWVSPLMGKPISDAHAEKSRNTLNNNAKEKRNKYHAIILDKCKSDNLIIKSHDYYYYELECGECDTTFQRTRQVFRNSKNGGKEICPTCYPPSFVSLGETGFIEYVKSIYDGKIIKNDRNILAGKEIDCFLPELNIGFEYCGIYWHSELYHEKNHLLNKQKFGTSRGIKIYTIFDNEWINQRDIVESRVSAILNCNANRLYARKTKISKISARESNIFLNKHHLQGSDKSSIRYGAFNDNILVAVMTFNKGGYVKLKNGGYELNRFCVKQFTSVVGIASKLFKTFIREYSPEQVVSYANSRWSYGDVYKHLGFKFKKLSPPCAWYTSDFKSLTHRASFMRHKIKDVDNYDSTIDAIHAIGYYRIYDCGNSVWEYNK